MNAAQARLGRICSLHRRLSLQDLGIAIQANKQKMDDDGTDLDEIESPSTL